MTETDNQKIERIAGAAEPADPHPQWRDRLDYLLMGAVLVLALGLVGLGLYTRSVSSGESRDHGKIGSLSSALSDANKQILHLGGTPVKTPVSVPTQAPVTDAQLLDQIAVYFAGHPVVSPTIDYEKIHGYVIEYLQNHPAPSGRPGHRGSPGPQGSQGATGPLPSSEMLAAAVSDYFQANPPQPGPTGPVGPQGPSGDTVTGPPGRGIASVDCTSTGPHLQDFTFTIKFTDGTSQTVSCTSPTATPTP